MSILRFRGYLPHLEHPESAYFVTYRLFGSVPQSVLEDWKFERLEIVERAKRQGREHTDHEKHRLHYLFSQKLQNYLDQGYGECWLRESSIAQLVVDNFKYKNGKRYVLEAWCVMPNHVHIVFRPISTRGSLHSDLIPILHSWKSYTAHEANKILKRSGTFWQDEYYDHLIRSDEEFAYYCKYTLENPVQANLCKEWSEWKWSGCSEKVSRLLFN